MKALQLFRQNWILVLCAVLPFERIPTYDLGFGSRSITIRLSYIVATAALVFFGWGAIKRYRVDWRQPQAWLFAYLFVIILSTFGSLSRSRSLVALIATFLVLGVSFAISRLLDTSKLPAIYRVLSITALFVCLFGLYQFLGDGLGLSTAWTGLRDIYTKVVFGFPRIQSTALEPLFLGNFLLIPLVLTTSQLVVGQLKEHKFYYLLSLLAMTLTLTLSRGSFAAAIGALGLVGVFLFRKLQFKATFIAAFSLGAGILAALGLITGINRVNQPAATTTQAVTTFTKQSTTVSSSQPGAADGDRVINRRLALDAFKERPLLGYGIGNFGLYAERAYPEMYADTGGRVTVNNEYYEILAETGAVGALALLGFALTLVYTAFKNLRKIKDLEQRTWIIALLAIGCGFAVQYYAFSTLYIMHIWVTLGLLMGLVTQNDKRKTTDAV